LDATEPTTTKRQISTSWQMKECDSQMRTPPARFVLPREQA